MLQTNQIFDIGALVWFAHIIEWEFPNFSVDNCKNRLLYAQQILEKNGCIEGKFIVFYWYYARRNKN